jgi:hypothetical protein
MHELARRAQAMILIRMAGERIRREHLDGTLDDETTAMVQEAMLTLDRIGVPESDAEAEYVSSLLRRTAINVVAAKAAGGDRAAEFDTAFAGAYLAAKQLRRDGAATPGDHAELLPQPSD